MTHKTQQAEGSCLISLETFASSCLFPECKYSLLDSAHSTASQAQIRGRVVILAANKTFPREKKDIRVNFM